MAAALAMVVGCTGRSTPPPTTPPLSSVVRPTRSPQPPTEMLAALTLRADLSERPGRWTPVLVIPFGERPDELGYRTFREGPAGQPSAFAVGPDGSFWIDDRWKNRVAHYSSTGRYLGQATGLDPRGWDLAIVDGTVFVLVEQATGTIGTVQDGTVHAIDVTDRGHSLFVFQLIPTVLGLVAEAAVVPGAQAGELGTFVQLQPDSPTAGPILPGLPLEPGDVFFDARPSEDPTHRRGDQDFDLVFASPEVTHVQPIGIELIVHDPGRERSVPAVVGLGEPLPVGRDVLLFVQIAPTRPDDGDRYGDGRWLLRIGRSALLWERLPDPDMTDELHHRHLGVGPDGSIYLMVTTRKGMSILRRSGPGE
jgi:hypothetical protein